MTTLDTATGEIIQAIDGVAVVPIDTISVEGRHRHDLGAVDTLADSIADIGLLHLPVVDSDLRLVSGGRRLAALQKLGRAEVQVHIVSNLTDAAALLRAERDENTCRKDMLPSELAALGEAIYEVESAQAKERQGTRTDLDQELMAPGRPKSGDETRKRPREVVGEALGMAGGTYQELRYMYALANDESASEEERDLATEALATVDANAQQRGGLGGTRAAGRKLRKEIKARRNPDVGVPSMNTATPRENGQRGHQGTKSINSSVKKQRGVLDRAVVSLSGYAEAIKPITEVHPEITTEEAIRWADDLSETRAGISRLINLLRRV
jgi:ParB family chromosome partitioning protein